MSKRQDEQGDWSADSASLFREVRRVLDAKAVERAPTEAVFARIQARGHEVGSEVIRASVRATDAATPVWLSQAAKGAVAVLLLGAASFGAFRAISEPSAQSRIEQPAPRAPATSAGSVSSQTEPTLSVASTELLTANKASVGSGQGPSRTAPQRRPAPARQRSQRTLASNKSAIVETAGGVGGDDPSSASAPSQENTQHKSTEATAAANPAPPDPTAARRTRVSEPPTQATTAPAARKESLAHEEASEFALVKRIHAELRETDFSSVLSLCAEHERRWPHGMFELEREGARAIASCGVRSNDAERRANQFLTAYPHAPVAVRVKSACEKQLSKQ